MNLCRVMGTVVATEKHAALQGHKILVVQPLDERLQEKGASFLAIDNLCSAGKGDVVLVANEGGGIRLVLEQPNAPIRSMVVGVVDSVTVE
jgi:microcompartment protein CcmK/EutM